jgi:hypothetical protein
MITRYDVYLGGPSSCEYEVTPVIHESNTVPVRRGYYCIRRVTLHRFNTFINVWGFFDPIPDVWRATSDQCSCLAQCIIDKGDFAVGFNSWRDSMRVYAVDATVSVQCEQMLLDAIDKFPNRWLARYFEKAGKVLGTQVPAKK